LCRRIAVEFSIRYDFSMHCLVTAGPTYEPMDDVRRLTNFSTGQLGSELANYLVARGHLVTLLISSQTIYRGERQAQRVEAFTTTSDLEERLYALGKRPVDAVFHAAAVSDFKFGKIWSRAENNELTELKSGKISTRQGTLLAELLPTSKILPRLRDWFSSARLVGWKFEVDGDRTQVVSLARKQILECRTDACVANGPAYGQGFGLVRAGDEVLHLRDKAALFDELTETIQRAK
jgi:phosphopantothenate---cysteine ligase (CTP)